MIITLDQMQNLSIDEIINLYRIGYRLEETYHNHNTTMYLADPTVDPIVNFGKVTVSALHNNTDTSIGIDDGSRLPDPSISGDFNLVWWNWSDYPDPSDDPNREIVRCTANSSNTLTVTRGQESISASNKNTSGKTYKMILTLTAKTISDIQTDSQNKVNTHSSASTGVHGASGSIVGTTDTQTLTNKTITDSSNNIMAKSLKSATTTVDVSAATAPSSGQVLTATASTTATWQTPAAVPAPSGTIVSETSFGQSSTAGSVSTYARGDHTHGTPAAPTIPAAASSVVSETSFGQGTAVGTSTLYSRADHTHGTPSSSGFMTTGNAASSVVSETSFGQSSAVGTSTNYARQDHTHGTPSGVYIGQSTSGQYASTRYSGSTSVNWNNGNVQSISLGNGANSIALSNGINGGRYMLLLTSGGTSSSATWSGGSGVKWPGGITPILSTTATKVDIVTFVFDGSYYYGNASFNY